VLAEEFAAFFCCCSRRDCRSEASDWKVLGPDSMEADTVLDDELLLDESAGVGVVASCVVCC